MNISPYWKEEEGISILADGYLGFVFDSKYSKGEPVHKDIRSFQTIHNEFLDSTIVAVKTNIKLGYQGNSFRTFLSTSYAGDRMKIIYDDAMDKVMKLKDQITNASYMLSAKEISSLIATKKYFLYAATKKNTIDGLISKLDFSYAKCGNNEAILINSDNIVIDMSICYNLGFWPVALPANVFQGQVRFLCLPLGAEPCFLSKMGLFAGSI